MRHLNTVLLGSVLVMFAVFFVLTGITLKNVQSPAATDAVARGKRVWQKKGCMGCHTILGNGAYFGPDLTKVVDRRGTGWLEAWLRDPQSVTPGTPMPNPRLSDADRADLITFLTFVNGINTNDWPPTPLYVSRVDPRLKPRERRPQHGLSKPPQEADTLRNPVAKTADSIARGRSLYQLNCVSCHGEDYRGSGPASAGMNPLPSDLRARHTQVDLSEGALFWVITNGSTGTAMPAWKQLLSENDRWHLVNFIRSLGQP